MTADSLPERVGRLETSVTNLHAELGDVKLTQRMQGDAQAAGFEKVQNTLSRGNQTNWPLIFGTITIMGALYAAAIAPLKQDVERAAKIGETLAQAVLVKDEQTDKNSVAIGQLEMRLAILADDVDYTKTNGSPFADKKIALLLQRVDRLDPLSKAPTTP